MASNLSDFLSTAQNLSSTVKQTVGTFTGNFATDSVKNIISGWNTGSKISITNAEFHQGAQRDWRVKLSLPTGYNQSDIISPLVVTNGLVFPYTPQITIQHSANYQPMSPVHNNYQFLSYENSKIDALQISGAFYCEDANEARYWVAAVHYLRSVTKMVYGASVNTGAPPPIIFLNGYGDYVFKNVPVVVTQFSVDMMPDVDYIATGLSSDGAQNIAERAASFIGPPKALSTVKPNMQSVAWAPVKSTFNVTVQPLYSREQVRQFSLDKFVKGEYVFNGKGYI